MLLAAALVLGGVVGVLVARDPGYVLVSYRHVAVETSLWFALLVVLAATLAVQAVWLVVGRAARGGGRLRVWRRQRRTRTARDQTMRGRMLMAEGRWAEARKLLESAAPRSEAPAASYLDAARAAQAMGDRQGRDALLESARQASADARFAVALTRAELLAADEQWEPCLATLLELYRQSPRHPRVLGMLASCYRQLRDWQAILELMDELTRYRAMSEEALRSLELDAWRGRLQTGRDSPLELWKGVPKALKEQPVLVAEFARALAADGDGDEAERALRAALQAAWDPDLLRCYATLTGGHAERRLAAAEGWLKQHPNDAELLLALGRISLMNRQWSKAREYLEASLRLAHSAEAQGELGRLCVSLGETERGAELLTQALQADAPPRALAALPLPERVPHAGTAPAGAGPAATADAERS